MLFRWAMNILVPYITGKSLSTWVTVGFSRNLDSVELVHPPICVVVGGVGVGVIVVSFFVIAVDAVIVVADLSSAVVNVFCTAVVIVVVIVGSSLLDI